MALRWRALLGLTLVMVLAGSHAATYSLVRPRYQVSDEVVYTSVVQAAAMRTAAPALAPCVAPPAGKFPFIPVQAKPGYITATARELVALCELGSGGRSLLFLRLAQAISLPVLAACAWALARALTGRESDALLAGVLVGSHPVAAVHAGGITPDAWANAFSALALLAGTRLLVGKGKLWDFPVLLAAVLLALAWKDTATFLLALPLFVLAWSVGRTATRGAHLTLRLTLLLATVAIVGAAGLVWFRTPYLATAPIQGDAQSVSEWLVAVNNDLLPQLGRFLGSSWTAIGNFGASTLSTSFTTEMLGVLLLVPGLAGAVIRLARTPFAASVAMVAVVWTLCGVLCLVQPSARQVLLGTQDVHQGRWLLPLLAPAAVFIACGLNAMLPRQRLLPLSVLAATTAAMLAVIDTVHYFWLSYPAALRTSALYVRGTAGAELDDEAMLSLIQHGATQIPVVLSFAAPALFLATAAGCLVHAVVLLDARSHV